MRDVDDSLVLLGIYLNDHLAGSTAGLDLFRRAAKSHLGTEVGEVLDQLVIEVTEDRQALLDMMAALRVPVRQYKVAAAWVAEKAGRFKLNGRLLHRSPLSDLVEFEGMRLGVEGKRAGWRTLRVASSRFDKLDSGRLDALIAGAERQVDTLEDLRMSAARGLVGITTQG